MKEKEAKAKKDTKALVELNRQQMALQHHKRDEFTIREQDKPYFRTTEIREQGGYKQKMKDMAAYNLAQVRKKHNQRVQQKLLEIAPERSQLMRDQDV